MLSQTTGYAITALTHIASKEETMLVKELAKAVDIPGPYLSKIIHTLARKGFVKTWKGIGGGVLLTRDPRTISLYELCEAFDDPISKKRCMLGQAECTDERHCPAHEFWENQRNATLAFLKNSTIADMLEFEQMREQKK